MLTGTRAFAGDNISDIVAAVLKNEPDWAALPPDTPPAVRRLLRRSLAKDARERFHDMADVRLEIADALSEPPHTPGSVPALTRERAGVVWKTIAAVALVNAVVLAWPAFLYFRAAAVDPPEMRVDITTPSTSDPLSFALSPDGSRLVFSATGDGPSRLWVRAMDAPNAQPLAGTEDGSYPFWAPDGRSIGFFANDKLKRVDLAGGAPRVLANTNFGRGGTWSADGIILFSPPLGALVRVPASGGELAAVTRLAPGDVSHRFPQFLPDGRTFLFFIQAVRDRQGIYLGPLDGGEPVRLASNDTAGVFVPPDLVLIVRQGTLAAHRLDLKRKTLIGEPITIADPVAFDSPLNIAAVTASGTNRLAYRSSGGARRQLTWVDRTGRVLGVVGSVDDGNPLYPELSPDGRNVAIERTVRGNRDIWIEDVSRGVLTRLTFDDNQDIWPIWSPDGRSIVFRSNRNNSNDFYRKPTNGAAPETLLLTSSQIKFPHAPADRSALARSASRRRVSAAG